jgi:hypothetical protein
MAKRGRGTSSSFIQVQGARERERAGSLGGRELGTGEERMQHAGVEQEGHRD